jgi:predicted thioesterase
MKESLVEGLHASASFTVTDDMSPPHLPVKVLSTPSMIQLIEGTCLSSVQTHLDDNETTVGTHVNVSHLGSAASGEEVEVTIKLATIVKRRLTFEIEVRSPRAVISSGTHERAVIDTSRFG